ncbi:MAG: hypothetical protein QW445_03425 [Candidatus Bathyarchaeia archaeon]
MPERVLIVEFDSEKEEVIVDPLFLGESTSEYRQSTSESTSEYRQSTSESTSEYRQSTSGESGHSSESGQSGESTQSTQSTQSGESTSGESGNSQLRVFAWRGRTYYFAGDAEDFRLWPLADVWKRWRWAAALAVWTAWNLALFTPSIAVYAFFTAAFIVFWAFRPSTLTCRCVAAGNVDGAPLLVPLTKRHVCVGGDGGVSAAANAAATAAVASMTAENAQLRKILEYTVKNVDRAFMLGVRFRRFGAGVDWRWLLAGVVAGLFLGWLLAGGLTL